MRVALLVLAAVAGLAAGCGKKTAADIDKEKLQGVWAVETWESLPVKDAKETIEFREQVRFSFEKDKFAVGGDVMVFTLDTASEPRVLKLMRCERPQDGRAVIESGTTGQGTWIYKFEGESLVIAISEFASPDVIPRAKEFKPVPHIPWQNVGVEVVRLKKTSEAVPQWLKDLTIQQPATSDQKRL